MPHTFTCLYYILIFALSISLSISSFSEALEASEAAFGESKKEKKEKDYQGIRKLPLELRVSAEKRYKNLIKKLFVPEDKDVICNQLLYIENGYLDYGYNPKLDSYFKHKNTPEGFWVYVYPNWYIWKTQVLF